MSVVLATIFGATLGALHGGEVVAQPASQPRPAAIAAGNEDDIAPVVGDVRFGRDIRPLLSDRCFQCHGGDASSRMADLRLDAAELATADRGGYAAIVPGDLAASEVWARITSDDPDVIMPPPGAKKRALTEADRAAIASWIEQGAPYESHWSFVAPRAASLPAVADPSWLRDELDAFTLARMQAAGVAPSPAADPAALARRVFLDLTGLPPSTEELDAFLAACAADATTSNVTTSNVTTAGGEAAQVATLAVSGAAYEALVDRLLTQEPYRSRVAEHFAVSWLDAARYADTSGIHTDNGRQMWLWRDQLLVSLRDNTPFDQFVTEQLAGDLLPDATEAQRVASGFNRNHVTTDEGGAIPEEYLVEYAVDRVNTVSSVFLGLTAGCARCHDHKFDPITQSDYYGLLAYFNSVDEPGLYSQTPDANRAYEPFLAVPSPEQRVQLDELEAHIEELSRQLDEPIPGEDDERREFREQTAARAGLAWTTPRVVEARSSEALTRLVLQDDGALLAEGLHPQQEDYEIVLATQADGLRLLLLEALSVPGQAGAGRASHGNAVISTLRLDVRSVGSGGEDAWRPVPLMWAWSDHTQTNFDHEPTRVLDDDHALGWAVDGNDNAGPRNLLLLSAEPFGEVGGSELRVRIAFRSPYAEHSLGRIRFRVSPLADASALAPSLGRWWRAGPFSTDVGGATHYDTSFGPELGATIDRDARFGPTRRQWSFDGALADGQVSALGDALGVTYVGRTIWSPDARELELALGSDDGVMLFHDGELVFENPVDRGPALDQDRTTIALHPGLNAVVLKVVNTGGPTAFAWQALQPDDVLAGELGAALLPDDAVTEEQREDFQLAWRRTRFAGYRELDDARTAARDERVGLETDVPATMVMQELSEPRPTFVLDRGQYDHPDEDRQVQRGTPAFLPPLPEGAPSNRLGLAQWLVAPENPLLARVSVNRLWALVFGAGLVRSAEDFGLQGSWPTHPELLDRLAVDFRESGWDVRALLRRLVTSATYRQASVVREDLVALDPDNELLARYPRRRLGAEQIRDLALYTSGLLVERFGGPSVKPYQPEGLWAEVSMLASNTRNFMRGEGEDLWRRSIYTYWKRAVPPPALMLLDAPTRESCVIQRQVTNTPLQALALWNDEQFVEAARKLAERALDRPGGSRSPQAASTGDGMTPVPGHDDEARVEWIMRTCTGRAPEPTELARLTAALDDFRARFVAEPDAAEQLLAVGEAAPSADHAASELAAWTLLANAVLNLHETLTQD